MATRGTSSRGHEIIAEAARFGIQFVLRGNQVQQRNIGTQPVVELPQSLRAAINNERGQIMSALKDLEAIAKREQIEADHAKIADSVKANYEASIGKKAPRTPGYGD